MQRYEAIRDWKARNEALTARLLAAVGGVEEERLNRRPDARTWSPAQVVEHLVLANGPYLAEIDRGLAGAPPSGAGSDSAVRYTLIGRLLIKAIGPGGRSPVPKSIRPRTMPVPLGIIGEWEQQQARLLTQIDLASGVNVARVRVRDPLAPLIPLTVADCIEILTVHTERHVRQIEERVAATLSGGIGTPGRPRR